jgi:hypothetical protein
MKSSDGKNSYILSRSLRNLLWGGRMLIEVTPDYASC